MASGKVIVVEQDNDAVAALLRQADEAPVTIRLDDRRYHLARDDDPFADYDPEKALVSFTKGSGLLAGVDVEALKAELRTWRD